MKIIKTSDIGNANRILKMASLAMKGAIVLFAFLMIAQPGRAQNITLNKQDISLSQLFQEIKKQTGYDFLYSPEMLKDAHTVSVNVAAAPLKAVLESCFTDQPVTYTLDQNTIIVKKKPVVVASNESKTSTAASIRITGRVLNQSGAMPVANASVFLSNATIGAITAVDGTFTLRNIKPGKYNLVVSVVGFESYDQVIVASGNDIKLADIVLMPKTTILNEVTIKVKRDPYRSRNYDWFKEDFLGTSYLARQCTILNPDKLDLDYDDATGVLTASSYDFLVIENQILGYRIKYLLADFTSNLKDSTAKKILYKGSVLYEEMKGSPAQEKRWNKNRQEIYENSAMHFLRAAAENRTNEEGFRVLKLVSERPSDSLINARIELYKKLSAGNTKMRDSLSYWVKKSKISKASQKLVWVPLKTSQFVKQAGQHGLYDLFCNNCALYVTYNKTHQFRTNDKLVYLQDPRNTDNSLINFKSTDALFYKNGIIADPYSVLYNGLWGRNRVADLLPVDYEPTQEKAISNDTTTTVEKAVAKLDAFAEQHPVEEAYLHLDKPYYAAGDTLYFKAYVTLGEEHKLSDLSGLLYVDLINTENKIDQSVRLQLVNGVSWGDFALPDSLPKGNYRIRAYTNVMRNIGEGAYFDQQIPVGSNHNAKITESGNRNALHINTKADIQFFPEGGQILMGVRSKIAFKAIGGNGLGIDVKGVIVDNENKELGTFTSAHLGMGYFYLTPQEGKDYKARVTYADGTINTVDIPKAVEKGIVLSVNNDSLPKASVRIEASGAYYQENKNKEYSLVIYSGGIAITVYCTLNDPVVTMDILKRRLSTGVATITLFSPLGEPLAERLFFIQKYDQLNLAINSDKTNYTKREKVNLRLNAKTRADEPTAGHFSVSVIDESKVQVDDNQETTILSDLLLASDLKGYVEQPNYYFAKISDKALADLDLVMLTHGFRKFDWKQVLSNGYPPDIYKPESALEITGTATGLGGKPLVNGVVSLIKMHNGAFISDTTDDKGRFHFRDLIFSDTDKFVLQAINDKGKNTTRLTYDKDVPPSVVGSPVLGFNNNNASTLMAAYMENNQKQLDDVERYGAANGRMLKNITIKGIRTDNIPITATRLVSHAFADQVILPEQMAKGGPFSVRIQGALHGIVIQNDSKGEPKAYMQGGRGRMRVIVDGVDTDGDLDEINGDDVESVDVLKYPGATGAYSGFAGSTGINKDGTDGILVITSKRNKGLQAADIASLGVLPITPKGFYKAREFYSPKYTVSTPSDNRPDLRTTIFWKPELTTNKDGNAAFEYYNADGPGTYRMVIEGIDDKGNIGRLVYRYKVK